MPLKTRLAEPLIVSAAERMLDDGVIEQRAQVIGGEWWKGLKVTDSPYDTYRYAGLPPGPIASPGRAQAPESSESGVVLSHRDLYLLAGATAGGAQQKSVRSGSPDDADRQLTPPSSLLKTPTAVPA